MPPSSVNDKAAGKTCSDKLRRDLRQRRRQEAMRQRAKARRDRLDRQMCQRRDGRRGHHGDQHARPIRPITPDQKDQRRRAKANAQGREIQRRQRMRQHDELWDQRARFRSREPEAAEILELACQDRDRDAGGETDRNGMRNMPDERAKPQGADQGQQRARDQDRQKQPFDAELRDRCGDQHDEGARRAADLEPAAAERRDGEAADDRRIKPALRRNPGGDRNRHR